MCLFTYLQTCFLSSWGKVSLCCPGFLNYSWIPPCLASNPWFIYEMVLQAFQLFISIILLQHLPTAVHLATNTAEFSCWLTVSSGPTNGSPLHHESHGPVGDSPSVPGLNAEMPLDLVPHCSPWIWTVSFLWYFSLLSDINWLPKVILFVLSF